MPNSSEQSVLRMPAQDTKLYRQMLVKFTEYQQRWTDLGMQYEPPEIRTLYSQYYAYRISLALMEKGELDTWQFSRQLCEELGGEKNFNMFVYERYCGVIDAYLTGKTDQVHGGTGLPEID